MSKAKVGLYFIALIPPEPIRSAAQALKEDFSANYSSKASLNSPPHVTLHMPFEWREEKEQKLIDALKDFSKAQQSVEVELTGFGSFPPRVIFIEIKKSTAIDTLQADLHRFCKLELNLFNARYRDLPFHPHVTLAFRDLKKKSYDEAWAAYHEKTFAERFTALNLILLKQLNNRWEIFMEFPFGQA